MDDRRNGEDFDHANARLERDRQKSVIRDSRESELDDEFMRDVAHLGRIWYGRCGAIWKAVLSGFLLAVGASLFDPFSRLLRWFWEHPPWR